MVRSWPKLFGHHSDTVSDTKKELGTQLPHKEVFAMRTKHCSIKKNPRKRAGDIQDELASTVSAHTSSANWSIP